ncbi:MAG: DNA repair and recombination protein RadB [Nanoarchaeota archaeon]|nr:DNA repair and recombination protein RadB [Nanoarchaeota archaeon]
MKIPTGHPLLDKFLNGGYEKGIITTIYGPSGSGKTNLCLLPLIWAAGHGKKIIYIDTEGSFSVERLKQITRHYKRVLENTLFFKPTNFEEQKKVFKDVRKVINKKIGLIIVDTISMLYRLELGQTKEIYEVNSTLGQQISYLMAIARKYKLPVLIANQVYADFKEKDKVNMVGGDLLKNGSKCLIELKSYKNGVREAYLRKHRSLPERKIKFKIINKGITSL